MLAYTLRLLGTSLRSVSSSRLGVFDESVITMRVWPSDVDTFGHMNNGRFLTVMDLGRNDLLVRSGAVWTWLRQRWTPLLGGATIRYKRALRPFVRYQLRTRVLGWDDKWFYFEQRFTRSDQVYAVAIVKALLQGPDGKVPPAELFASIGHNGDSPTLPESVALWLETEMSMMGYS